MRAQWIASILLALLVGCDSDRTLRPAAPEPQRAANEALDLLKGVVDEETYRDAGFDSLEQASRAELGTPIEVYVVGLDQLKGWSERDDANALILKNKSVEAVYPVMIGNQVKSTVSIFKTEGGYRPATFGDAEIANALARYRRSDAAFIVRVPVAGTYFIGQKSDNEVYLTPVYEMARLPNSPPGRATRSADLLPQLAALAKAQDADMPR